MAALKVARLLRWYASHSVEINENINLGYSQIALKQNPTLETWSNPGPDYNPGLIVPQMIAHNASCMVCAFDHQLSQIVVVAHLALHREETIVYRVFRSQGAAASRHCNVATWAIR